MTEIHARPTQEHLGAQMDTIGFTWLPERTLTGRFRVLVRVHDRTPTDNGHPWVIADPHGLLESERGWWVELSGER